MDNSRKSGSRPFSPIYENFQNLLDNNQGIFRLFRKTKNPGMYQAVWQARQGEVETYKERLNRMERRVLKQVEATKNLDSTWREHELSWFEQHHDLLEKIHTLQDIIHQKDNDLEEQDLKFRQVEREHQQAILKIEEETIQGLEKEIEAWKEKAFTYREDLDKYKLLSRSLQRVVDMKNDEQKKSEKDFKRLENHLNLSQHALIKLDDEYETVKSENEVLKKKIEELEEDLKKAHTYAKEFRRINHRMENELYRVNTELERAQSMFN